MPLATELNGNKNNPAMLKLHIARNYSKIDSVISFNKKEHPTLEESKWVPHIKLDNDRIIFTPNAALWYLFQPSTEYSDKVNEYLELDSTLLSPSLAHVLGSNLESDKYKSLLTNVLKKLNADLLNKSVLVGDDVTAADISLWSTLFPLYRSEKLNKDYLSDNPNLVSWIQKLELIAEFKNAVSAIFPPGFNIGESSYQILLQSSKFFFSNFVKHKKEFSYETDVQKNEIDSISVEELEAAAKAWQKTGDQLPKLKTPETIIVPKTNEKNIFITSALPYVNNVPHLGNIIGCVLSADVFARFCRLCNYNTIFVSGTDEYGTATETKALEEGLSCQAICDKYYKIHEEIYKWFNISFDTFGRTSAPEQKELVQELFLELNHNGFMFTQSVEQLHCEKCNRYLADRFVEGGCPNIGCTYLDARGDQCDGCGKLVNAVELKNPRCKVCGNTPKLTTSNQFFIDLPKLEPLLHHWLKFSSPGWSYNADVITRSWLKEGLKPRCITRDLKWGVPVPIDGYRDKVFYVWFDAPIGYMSITKSYTKDFEKWWKPSKNTEITLYQFMAKDNVPFHSVLFPAMLLGVNKGYLTVSHIWATEYLNYEDGKFSKSRGVGVFGNDARNTGIPSDVWRFYLLSIRPETQDSSFSWIDLVTKNNSELLNNLGNFVNRALVFAKNSFGKQIPNMELTQEDFSLLALCTREFKSYTSSLEKGKLRDGLKYILQISKHGNQYIQVNQPWVLVKGSKTDKSRAGTVVGVCCNLACLIATLIEPYMPDTSANLKRQLNCKSFVIDPSNPEIVNLLPAGHQLDNPAPLFTKIEPSVVEELRKKFAGKQETKLPSQTDVDIGNLEQQIVLQGDKVRLLKSSGADKSVWQPEVQTLLELKKKMETVKKQTKSKVMNNTKTETVDGRGNDIEIENLEEKIAKQGSVVRKLKESGAEKSVWLPEVNKLLAFKTELAAVTGVPIQANQTNKKSKNIYRRK
ncbi:methionine--tRNA ligase, cytoplasmic [Cylas formicarius]|uniref:methionine--tRNA ligase, cytoplasmic n=1 Tax=Cylas formicarius TaxID=197179 RepID=UPI0029585D24|nr:methionine--tRNA ligase, cytoplasmic [Cylas formicarius]